jgi:hypothetical protein
MLVSDAEVERLAREMIATHGPRAARAAAERLNEMIDRNNIPGRDVWACVVQAIHARQGSGPAWDGPPRDWRNPIARLAAVIPF